jgi:hypothetical protein
VLSKHIKNGQVKTADLGANAVNSSKVGNGSLLAQDFAAGQIPAGPQGPQGKPGLSGHRFAGPTTVTLPAGETDWGVVICAPGERALGGGAVGDVTTAGTSVPGVVMNSSSPFGNQDGSPSGWRVAMTNTDTVERSFTVYVYCAKVGS